jgi:transposase
LPLTAAERAQLADARDHHTKPYVRERAAALLKVAAGQSVRMVARAGCLKPRDPEAVGGWVRRFRQGGVAGLAVRPGRGRKPAFSPSARPASRRRVGAG